MLNEDSDELEEEAEYDKAEVESAKKVVQHITKTAKTLKIYLPNNPIHQKFIDGLFTCIEEHVETYGPLKLRVKQFELFCSGQSIYENLNRLESLAFKLFIDGLRELSFHPGIEKDEMIDLLHALGHDGSQETENLEADADDDIVTLLWEKHLIHIQYIVVDDFRGEVDSVETSKEMKREAPKPQRLNAIYQQEVVAQPTAPRGIEVPDLQIFKLTEDEVSAIKRELRWEEEIDIVAELEGMLFDILRIERDPVPFLDVLGIIDDIFNQLMLAGDFTHARKILAFYWEMLDPEKGLDLSLAALVQKVLTQAGSAERINRLGTILNHMSSEQLDDFMPLMVLFSKGVIPALIELMASVDALKPRRVLCDILVELGHLDIDPLLKRLNDRRWFVVRNLIYILGKIGDERAIDAFERHIRHKEVKVRKEVLHVLDALDHPRAAALLSRFVSDTDLSNRVYAIKGMVKKGVTSGVPLLLTLVDTKGFEQKAMYEKKEIFSAIGKLGKDDVVPKLQPYLKSGWRLIKNTAADERGLCAALALQRIGSPVAITTLQEGAGSRNKVIRQACEKALAILNVKGKA